MGLVIFACCETHGSVLHLRLNERAQVSQPTEPQCIIEKRLEHWIAKTTMIKHLKLRNFKAFESLNMELRPITIILGQNNSGKSAIIAPFRLLIQTMESFDQAVPLLLNGSMGDFGTYKDLVFGNHRGRVCEISVELGENKENFRIDLQYKYRTQRREIILKHLGISRDNSPLASFDYSAESERMLLSSLGGKSIRSQFKASLSRSILFHHFIPLIMALPSNSESKTISDGRRLRLSIKQEQELRRDVNHIGIRMRRGFAGMDYVGAMRNPPERTYLFTGEKRSRIGAAGENAASLLAMDSHRRGTSKKRLVDMVSDWLAQAGVAKGLRVKPISDRHYELRITHPVSGENQNLADVGYGNSQIIPVLVGGYRLERNSTYFVEEPEIHLHPRAQAELGDFILDLYKRSIQTVVETHSEYLVLRLQQLVADKKIKANDVGFYYVNAKRGRKKSVKLMDIDEVGRFRENLPHGFFPERLSEAEKLAKIRFRQSKIK